MKLGPACCKTGHQCFNKKTGTSVNLWWHINETASCLAHVDRLEFYKHQEESNQTSDSWPIYSQDQQGSGELFVSCHAAFWNPRGHGSSRHPRNPSATDGNLKDQNCPQNQIWKNLNTSQYNPESARHGGMDMDELLEFDTIEPLFFPLIIRSGFVCDCMAHPQGQARTQYLLSSCLQVAAGGAKEHSANNICEGAPDKILNQKCKELLWLPWFVYDLPLVYAKSPLSLSSDW